MGILTGDEPVYKAPMIDPGYTEREKEVTQDAMINTADLQKQRIAQSQKAQGLLNSGNAVNAAINQRAQNAFNDQMHGIVNQSGLNAIAAKQSRIEKAYGYTNKINSLIAQQKKMQYLAELNNIETRNAVIGSVFEVGGLAIGMGMRNKKKSIWDVEDTPMAGESYNNMGGQV
jgi:hypothetical protein